MYALQVGSPKSLKLSSLVYEVSSSSFSSHLPIHPGKDAEPREDPGKYYLVDPMEVVKNSPLLGVSSNNSTQEHRTHHHPVSKSYHRRPGSIPRRNVNTTALSSTEASGDGVSAWKKAESLIISLVS